MPTIQPHRSVKRCLSCGVAMVITKHHERTLGHTEYEVMDEREGSALRAAQAIRNSSLTGAVSPPPPAPVRIGPRLTAYVETPDQDPRTGQYMGTTEADRDRAALRSKFRAVVAAMTAKGLHTCCGGHREHYYDCPNFQPAPVAVNHCQ